MIFVSIFILLWTILFSTKTVILIGIIINKFKGSSSNERINEPSMWVDDDSSSKAQISNDNNALYSKNYISSNNSSPSKKIISGKFKID